MIFLRTTLVLGMVFHKLVWEFKKREDRAVSREYLQEQNKFSLKSVIKFVKRSDNEVKDLMSMLRNKAFLERESDVNVIWNAQGNVPMVSGSHMKIQDLEYVTLGVLYENHLVVQYKGEKG